MVTANRLLLAYGLALVLWGSQLAQGTTFVSPERTALGQLATAIKVYPLLHNGQRVTTWAQVREVFDLDAANKSLIGKPSYPLEAHYEFVNQKVAVPGYEGSEVIMVRTVPLQRAEGEAKWRYLVGQSKDGSMTATRMPEEEVRAMFQQAAVPLPAPRPGLPPVELEVMPKLDEPPPNASAAVDATPTPAAPAPATSVPTATPSVPPQPATSVAQTPDATVERKSPVWPWLVGIAALSVIALLVWKRRA
jgi:hypothetical protein